MYPLLHICSRQRDDADAGVHPRTGERFYSCNSIGTSFAHMCLLNRINFNSS
jgi:hypothetical protein